MKLCAILQQQKLRVIEMYHYLTTVIHFKNKDYIKTRKLYAVSQQQKFG
jgi:hypothetical protein